MKSKEASFFNIGTTPINMASGWPAVVPSNNTPVPIQNTSWKESYYN